MAQAAGQLTKAEMEQLRALMAKSGISSPSTDRPHTTRWQALISLSVPQQFSGSDPSNTRQTDLVSRGEIVDLTDEQVRNFQTKHQVPVIRPASQANDPMPVITAQMLIRRRPVAEQFDARPDPPGSSQLMVPAQPGQPGQPQPSPFPPGPQQGIPAGYGAGGNPQMAGDRLFTTPEFHDPRSPVPTPQQVLTAPAQAPHRPPARQPQQPGPESGEAMDIPPRSRG